MGVTSEGSDLGDFVGFQSKKGIHNLPGKKIRLAVIVFGLQNIRGDA